MPRISCRCRHMSLPILVLLLTGAQRLLAQPVVLVEVGDEWKYRKGTTAPPDGWQGLGFDDSGAEWLSGPTGIGYADNDDATVLEDMQAANGNAGYVAFFARRVFTVTNLGAISTLGLDIDYDDGFVAYLNGVEVARRGLGADGSPVAFNLAAVAREAGAAELINVSPASLVAGTNVLAIELHNAAIDSTDASLIPRLITNAVPGPTGLTCAAVAGGVRLGWTNNGGYDNVRVERNGATLISLPGDATTFTDTAPTSLDNRYVVHGEAGETSLPSNACAINCTQGTLTCVLSLVDGVTQAHLSWSGVADATTAEIRREGAARANLNGGETSYVDLNVQDQMAEDDTDYTVILTTPSGICTLACTQSLCPSITGTTAGGQLTLTIGNMVRNWDHLEISRNGQMIDANVPPTVTTWVDPNVVLEVGSSYDYLIHPVPAPGSELPDPGTQCDIAYTIGYAPELGSFNTPDGGWDYKIDFNGPGEAQYNPNLGEPGNLDGRWIRAVDLDLWNGRRPDDAPGPAPGGPAPGGLDVLTRAGQGICGTGDVGVLRVLDPGDPAVGIGAVFPDPFDPPANSRIVLGLDLGVTDRNVLKSGITLATRLRLAPNPPAYMNANPASGDGSPIANGIGMVGVYYRESEALPDEGLNAGASVSLQSGANGGDLQLSSAGQDVDAIGTLSFTNVWLTVVGGATPNTYDVKVYLNGALNTSTEVGGTGLTLDAGVADLGPGVSNYLLIAANDTANDAYFEIDYVAYKLGVHDPASTACEGDPPGVPTGLALTPGDARMTLNWTAPGAGPTPQTYAIYRDGTRVASVSAAATTYLDVGLANGTTYCYRVRAVRGILESAPSEEACAAPEGGGGGPRFHRGDADNNGQLQLTDAVRILGFLFLGQAAPTCIDAADADDNGQLQLTDAVRVLGYLFLGQAPPSPPGPPGDNACGEDPTADGALDLGCETYTNC